jgi:hypothetical protein
LSEKAAVLRGRGEYLEGEVGMNAKGTLALSILSLATFVGLSIEDARAEDKANASGTWKWTGKSGEYQGQEITGTLKQDGDKLSGTVGSAAGEIEIEKGKAKDGHVSFQITLGERLIKFSGKQDGDTIKGKVEISEGGNQTTVDWNAKRVRK